MTENRKFPYWAGPVAGAIVCPYMMLRTRLGGIEKVSPHEFGFWIGIGLFAGSLIGVIEYLEQRSSEQHKPRPVLSWTLIVLTPLLFWVPLLGVVITLAAIYRTPNVNLPELGVLMLWGCFFIAAAICVVTVLMLTQ